MMTRSWTRACLLVLALLLVGPGAARAQCAGFADVTTTDGFCPSVQWLKNRAVTLGCGSGGNYCPQDPVSRLAMAAFMNRLGTALTPTLLPVATATVALNLAAAQVNCTTADHVVPAYPQRAFFRGSADYYGVSTATVVSTELVYSLDAGSNWIALPGVGGKTTVPASGGDATITPYGRLDLAPGQSVRFAMRSSRSSGTGNPSLYCVTQVEIGNRNGSVPPY